MSIQVSSTLNLTSIHKVKDHGNRLSLFFPVYIITSILETQRRLVGWAVFRGGHCWHSDSSSSYNLLTWLIFTVLYQNLIVNHLFSMGFTYHSIKKVLKTVWAIL